MISAASSHFQIVKLFPIASESVSYLDGLSKGDTLKKILNTQNAVHFVTAFESRQQSSLQNTQPIFSTKDVPIDVHASHGLYIPVPSRL